MLRGQLRVMALSCLQEQQPHGQFLRVDAQPQRPDLHRGNRAPFHHRGPSWRDFRPSEAGREVESRIGKEYEKQQKLQHYLEWLHPILKELGRIMHPNGSLCWPQAPRYTSYERLIKATNFDEAF